jgi:hypothetical protein
MLQQGLIGPELLKLFNEGAGSGSKRQHQTRFINALFLKDKKTGAVTMQPKNPVFAQFRRNASSTYGVEETKGYPRSVMLHHFFHGNETAMEDAVQAGEVQVSGGVYSFNTVVAGKRKESTAAIELQSGGHEVSSAVHAKLASYMDTRAWRLPVDAAASSSSAPAPQLALPAAVDWAKVEPVVQEASAAQERLEKEGLRLKQKVAADDNLKEELKGTVQTLQGQRQDLENLLLWKELPTRLQQSFTQQNLQALSCPHVSNSLLTKVLHGPRMPARHSCMTWRRRPGNAMRSWKASRPARESAL